MKPLHIGVVLFASLLFYPYFGFAGETAEESTCNQLRTSEAKLVAIYKQLISKYRHDQQFIRKLRKSQQSWVAYKEAQLELIYPHGPSPEYGSIYSTCRCQVLGDFTADRIKVLEQWLNGIDMGDVCTGSRPVKK